jgi:ankyrin repeat protein
MSESSTDAKDTEIEDSLIKACKEGNDSEVERILLSLGAIEAAKLASLAIFSAMETLSAHILVAILIDRGADPNASDENGYSPLMTAATYNRVKAISTLIDAGANLNYQNPNNGWTALMNAAYFGNAESARVLLGNGANPNIKSQAGLSALDIAKGNHMIVTAAYLESQSRQ